MSSRTQKILSLAQKVDSAKSSEGEILEKDEYELFDNISCTRYVVIGNDLVQEEEKENNAILLNDTDPMLSPKVPLEEDVLYFQPHSLPDPIIYESELPPKVKRNIFSTEPSSLFVPSTKISTEDTSVKIVPATTAIEESYVESDCDVVDPTDEEYIPKPQDLEESESEGECEIELADEQVVDGNQNCTTIEVRKVKARNVPKKTNPGKKRYRNPNIWKRNLSKEKRNRGEEYINVKGRVVQERKMGPACNTNCRKKCQTKINETQRQLLFRKFWQMGDYNKQSTFIGKYVKVMPKKRQIIKENGEPSRRNLTLSYNLPSNSSDLCEDNVVCKSMFLNTLGITDMWVMTCVKKLNSSTVGIVTPDKRGHHEKRGHLIPAAVKESVREHINSFPCVDSHYCRARSNKKYLEEGLSIAKMYRLYIEFAEERKLNAVASERQYREIFNKEFNLSFFLPKKDLCDVCFSYNNKLEKTENDEENQRQHLLQKEASRKLKEEDKMKAETRASLAVACFDLEKVISIPQCDVSSFYYKCKLSVYNFTIFDLHHKQGYCYIWSEQIAKRGSIEIASCVFDYIKQKASEGKKTICLYSDNCVGQNKNKYIISMYIHASKKYNVNIEHRFLEQGHTQNENDSIHALIEKNKKGKEMYTPDQFVMLVKMCKVHGKPYIVKEITQNDVFDFKALSLEFKNFQIDSDNRKVRWNAVREIKIQSENTNIVQIRYDLTSDNFVSINLNLPTRRNKSCSSVGTMEIPLAYHSLLPLPKKKYEHLLYMSKKVPQIYKAFYDSLTFSNHENSDDEV